MGWSVCRRLQTVASRHDGLFVRRSAARFTSASQPAVPVIDLRKDKQQVAASMYEALSEWGVFVATGHGVPAALSQNAFEQARAFFAQPLEEKLNLSVTKGGIAWRGYMPRGGEFTKGNEDQKEGLYVGPEHTETHPRWGTPLYGRNLFPDAALPGLRPAVLRYIREVDALGHRLMGLLGLSLGLDEGYFARHVTGEAINIVRLFNYPPAAAVANHTGAQTGASSAWGIGRHTDYGLWTMLQQDAPGLEYEHPVHGWQPVPFLARTGSLGSWATGGDAADDGPGIVCAAGDILDRMTGGRFKSRPHRARNLSTSVPRLTIPFFFDPSWDAIMKPLPLDHLGTAPADPDRQARWDATSIVSLEGPYSGFLAKKVSKIFADVVPAGVAEGLHSTRGPSTRFTIKIPVKHVASGAN